MKIPTPLSDNQFTFDSSSKVRLEDEKMHNTFVGIHPQLQKVTGSTKSAMQKNNINPCPAGKSICWGTGKDWWNWFECCDNATQVCSHDKEGKPVCNLNRQVGNQMADEIMQARTGMGDGEVAGIIGGYVA